MRKSTINLIVGIIIGIVISGISNSVSTDTSVPNNKSIATTVMAPVATTEPIETNIDVDTPPSPRENLVVEAPREVICNQEDETVGLEEEEVVNVIPSSAPAAEPGRVEVEPLRRSTRIKKEPAYLKDYV